MILKIIKIKVFSENTTLKYKVSENDFTRRRKQSFSNSILLMMNFLTKSLSIEIENFVCFIRNGIGLKKTEGFTKSAFVQCRKKIKPEVFKYLSESLVEEFYTDNDESVKLWNGFRLLAVDGSRMTLPETQELEDIYGKTKNQTKTGVVQARVSVLYDVVNQFVIDGCLTPLSTGETKLAIQHLEFSSLGDLIIYDRGYPSFNLMYEHFQRKIDFLIRVKSDFSNVTRKFYESGQSTETVKMYPGKNTKLSDKPYNKKTSVEVRLVRVELTGGDVEILITSLLDLEKYPDTIFKDLYFMRWGVETYYDELKNKIKAEHFSGYSQHSILQDFYAALFVSNIQSLIVGEMNDELATKTENKYQYKVNTNLSYGFLKNRIVELFLLDQDMSVTTTELKKLFKKHTVPIRPNRKNIRHVGKYRKRTKPKVLINYRDAI